ncbi:MAG: fatty acid desaturase [Candidatus Omnitrophica bacterium]|nr:fatty acid desaturase [Candidatus Omnitrophota bacterium]
MSTLRPWRAVMDTARCWTLILAAWIACSLWPKGWVFALAIPVIGCNYYGLFILGHDAVHGRTFNSLRLNNLFADLFMFAPIGAITRINKWNHLEHHRLLATEADPDRFKYRCFGKADFVPFAIYLIGLYSFFIAVRNVFIKGPRQAASPDPREKRLQHSFEEIALLVCWQGALIAGLTWAAGAWWGYAVLWLAPGFCFAFLADNLRTFCEHSQPQADSLADRHRLITYVSNPVEKFFLAPFNMNFHATHHLWPSIPYYNLPKADWEIRRMAGSGGLEWRTSYLGYVIRYLLALPLEECKAPPVPVLSG